MFGSGNDLGFGIHVGIDNGFSGPANQIINDSNRLSNSLSQMAGAVGSGLGNIDSVVKQLEATVRQSEARISGGFKIIAASMAALIPLGLGVRAATELDSLTRGLNAVSTAADPVGAQLLRLEEIAKLPGLGFTEAISASTNLQATGISAKLAEKSMMAFGNALATVGKGKAEMQGVFLALTQVMSKGKVMAQEINQIAERVPQIRLAMKAAFGTADTEVLQKMKLSSTAFIEGVVNELGKLPKVTGGIGNAFENFSDSLFRFMAGIGQALIPILEPIINFAAEALTWLRKLAEHPIGKWIVRVAAAMALLVAAFGAYLVVSGLAVGASARVALALKEMGFQQLFTAYTTGGLSGAMGVLGSAIWAALAPLLPFIAAGAALVLVGKLILDNIGKQGNAWEKLKAIGSGVMEIFQTWNGRNSELSAETKKALEENGILNFFQKLSTWVVRAIEFTKGFFKPMEEGFASLGELVYPLEQLFREVGELLKSLGIEFGAAGGSAKGFGDVGRIVGESLLLPFRILQGLVWIIVKLIEVITWVINVVGNAITSWRAWKQELQSSGSWVLVLAKGLEYLMLPLTMVFDQFSKLVDLFKWIDEKVGVTEFLASVGVIKKDDDGKMVDDPREKYKSERNALTNEFNSGRISKEDFEAKSKVIGNNIKRDVNLAEQEDDRRKTKIENYLYLDGMQIKASVNRHNELESNRD